jgi:UDP-N-acetylmuramoyl-tripeptide--D-alanyl-D-alanine ligase
MHLVRCSNDRIIIDDCYNANPQAMAEALRILAQTEHPRRMAVLGDMGELGDLTEQAHRDMGTLARTLGLNTVVAIGPKAKAIQEADPDALWFPTVTEALPAIRAAFTAGTAVLVKASHAMHFTDIVKDLEATE